MKLLLLNGHGMNLWVDGARLHIKDGRISTKEQPQEYVFEPKRINVDHIVIYGHNGNITFDAIKWLIKHNVQITWLDWNGKLLTTMLPPDSVQVKTKLAQYQAYGKPEARLQYSRAFLDAKFSHTKIVLDYLHQRYPIVNPNFTKELPLYRRAKSIPDLMIAEARIAGHYWQELTKIIPSNYKFESRAYQKRPRGAGDTVNCLLNYGYAILEAECLRAINTAGLDAHVGFMHEMRIGTNSLAYDLQEPYRFLIDLAVLSLIEQGTMEKSDFVRTETYTLKLRATGARKLIAAIDEQLNKKATFQGQEWSWRYIIQTKTQALAHHLIGKKATIDFIEPNYPIPRQDDQSVRDIIKDISYVEWKKLGFSKGTLHYLKHNAKGDKPFTMNAHVRERIRTLYPEIAVNLTEKRS